MPFRPADPSRSGLLARGIHLAPWLGPDGELVLVAVTSKGRTLREPITLPHGADRIGAAEALWEELERADPVAHLKVC
ncbi:MAG: hypothetical protein ACYC3F_17005 [Gemmatimonadaceae bacterium]